MNRRPSFVRRGKSYSSTIRGRSFEDYAFDFLTAHIVSANFGVLPECSAIFQRKRYYSRNRDDMIEFDISIEVTLPGAPEPSFFWLWECKNYSGPIGVDALEEFDSKVQQVSGLNVKAGVITSSHLQSGALAFAASKKMAVIRILPDENVRWMLYSGTGEVRTEVSADAFGALTEPIFLSLNRTEFGASHGRYFPVVSELFKYVLLTEAPDLPPAARLRLV